MPLHVIVSAGGFFGPTATETDVSEDALRNRFLEPYERGEAIVAGGKTFPPSDPPTVEILEGPSAAELKEAHGFSDPGMLRLAGHLQAVTGRFISRPFGSVAAPRSTGSGETGTGSIFIVHGRNTDRAARVASFVRNLVEPTHPVVVLKDTEDAGETLIEKFEREAVHVAFAVVIATADDHGALSDETEAFEPRARQNVILELGYFWGALGREKVAVLPEPGVVLPSDLAGLLTVDSEDERQLARRLRAGGVAVNADRLLD